MDLSSLLVAIVAGFPVSIADSLLLFLFEGRVQLLKVAIVTFCQHGHIDCLSEGHADARICGEGRGCRQSLVGRLDIRASFPIG